MKKIVLLLAILMLASFAMSSCGAPSTPPAGTTPNVQDNNEKSNLGKYNVVIADAYVDGNLYIKYIFTNNSSQAESFEPTLVSNVYQDGIALNVNIYSDRDRYTDIKPGASIEIDMRYHLRNETSDIEIEIVPLGKTSPKATKTFRIADLKK